MKYNIPEKYVHIEFKQHGLDETLVQAKITTSLMPGNVALYTFGEQDRRQFEQNLPKYVRDLTHGYTEQELRDRQSEKAPEPTISGNASPKSKKSTWTQNATIVSVGENPFKAGSKAQELFEQVTIDKSVKQNIADGVEFRVLRAAWEKGKLKLSTDTYEEEIDSNT